MKTRSIIVIIVLSGMLITLPGCQYLKKRVEKKEKTEYTLNSTGKFRIEIENTNGNVEIIPADDTLKMIYVTAEVVGKVRINEKDKPIEGVEVKIDTAGEIIKVETNYKNIFSVFGNENKAVVNYTVKVPSTFKVLVNLTNGSINASNLRSDSRFENVNGNIYINRCSGTLDLETVNGRILANVDSTKGFIAETVNGSISIGGLKNANANVEASCVNGKVKTENLNFSTLTSEKKSLSGKIGTGADIIRLTTINGSIKLDGNYISILKKNNVEWHIGFDFDEDKDPVEIEIKHSDEQKGVGITPKDTLKAKDSVKSK